MKKNSPKKCTGEACLAPVAPAETNPFAGHDDIVAALRNLPPHEFPDITDRVMTAVAAEKHRAHLRRAWRVTAASAAAAVLTFALFMNSEFGVRNAEFSMNSECGMRNAELAAVGSDNSALRIPHSAFSETLTPAVTGLTLLTLVSQDTPAFDEQIANAAAQTLRRMQQPDGRFGTGERNETALFNHGVATVAMLRLYETGRFPELFTPIDGALNFIRTTQNASGGWARTAELDHTRNTDFAGIWMTDALSRAERLGWGDNRGHLRRALRRLETAPDALAARMRDAATLLEKQALAEALCDNWLANNTHIRSGR